MRRLDAGTSGRTAAGDVEPTSEVELEAPWAELVHRLTGGRPLRPVQRRAIDELGILDSRRNLVVAAPTNSGKSLIGYLLLFDAVSRGQRAILLEPLRALAQEKADELHELVNSLPSGAVGYGASVRLTTGDYRLEGEAFSDPPPDDGEIVVATPERLQAILRRAGSEGWVERIGAVVVDEAHLIGSAHRGPTLEFVIAVLKSLPAPPRIGLLSATIGEPQTLSEWLEPCDLLSDPDRHPPLEKYVAELEDGDDADAIIASEVAEALANPEASVLVFVYQRASCERLCRLLAEHLDGKLEAEAVRPYHSGMTAAARRKTRDDVMCGDVRCVVATTALALGVNLPATHVIVRDVTFFGSGRVPTEQILQMLGRAGRGQRAGTGVAVVKPNDGWKAGELSEQLRLEVIPEIRSQIASQPPSSRKRDRESKGDGADIAEAIAGFLARAGDEGMSQNQLRDVLANTLGGAALADATSAGLAWLEDPERILAFRDESDRYRLTALGKKGVRAALPLPHVAGIGQLFRDVLSVDNHDSTLRNWSFLDHLILAELLSGRSPGLRRFSERLAEQVDGWMERQPQATKSVMFRSWISGAKGSSKAVELLGSLGVRPSADGRPLDEDKARARAYLAAFSAILLLDRGNGESFQDLSRRWDLKSAGDLAGSEESWRDVMIWLVSGQAATFEVRCFYHHLITDCVADRERIARVKQALKRMNFQSHELQEMLRFCSPLGPLLRGVRGMMRGSKQPTAAIGTIRCLEAAGIESIENLATLEVSDLVAMGVQKRFAKQILHYVARRRQ